MKKAEWILRSHREQLATLKLLKAKLQQIDEITESEKNDYIETHMLQHTQLDGMPKMPSQNSRTEMIALTYNDALQAERSNESQDLLTKMQDIRFYLRVYDAMLSSLTPDEVWLARERYVNGKSLGRMLLEMPDSIAIRSKATLIKHCTGVIDQLEHFIININVDMNSK